METKKIELDRDTKILLLSVLKKGYFSEQDTEIIRNKISVLDPFAQMRLNNNIND